MVGPHLDQTIAVGIPCHVGRMLFRGILFLHICLWTGSYELCLSSPIELNASTII